MFLPGTHVPGHMCMDLETSGDTDCPRTQEDKGTTPSYLSVLGSLGDLGDQGSPEVQVAQRLQGNHDCLLGLVSPALEDRRLLESPWFQVRQGDLHLLEGL